MHSNLGVNGVYTFWDDIYMLSCIAGTFALVFLVLVPEWKGTKKRIAATLSVVAVIVAAIFLSYFRIHALQ